MGNKLQQWRARRAVEHAERRVLYFRSVIDQWEQRLEEAFTDVDVPLETVAGIQQEYQHAIEQYDAAVQAYRYAVDNFIKTCEK